MNWESPNLSKQDLELLTITLDDYIFYAKRDGVFDCSEVEKLLIRLEDHLQNY